MLMVSMLEILTVNAETMNLLLHLLILQTSEVILEPALRLWQGPRQELLKASMIKSLADLLMLHWYARLRCRFCGVKHNVDLRWMAEAWACSACLYTERTATAWFRVTSSIPELSSIVIELQSRPPVYCTAFPAYCNENRTQKRGPFVPNLHPLMPIA